MVTNLFPGKISKNLEKQVFKMYDTSNDGFIDFPEFLVVYAIMKDGKPEDKLRSVFKVIDINNDGWITVNELKRLVKDMFVLLRGNDTNEVSEDYEEKVKEFVASTS